MQSCITVYSKWDGASFDNHELINTSKLETVDPRSLKEQKLDFGIFQELLNQIVWGNPAGP
jgi:hypothetical protein